MHQELLHVDFQFELALVLHLIEANELLMTHYLVLVMRVGEEEVRLVIAKGLVCNLELNKHT